MNQPTDRPPLADVYRVHPGTSRTQAIEGLRKLADMLAAWPELPTPYAIVVQAGPLDGDWNVQRLAVVAAARALGQPLTVDEADRCTVRAELGYEMSALRVAYVVHAQRPTVDVSPVAAAAEVPADLAARVVVPAESLEETPVDPLSAIQAAQVAAGLAPIELAAEQRAPLDPATADTLRADLFARYGTADPDALRAKLADLVDVVRAELLAGTLAPREATQ